MPIKDLQKRRKYYRDYYKRTGNPSKVKLRKKFQLLANRYKSICGCLRCGERNYRCLDYHHKDRSTKFKSVSYLVQNGNLQALKDEIRKCEVICANCHRKEHSPT